MKAQNKFFLAGLAKLLLLLVALHAGPANAELLAYQSCRVGSEHDNPCKTLQGSSDEIGRHIAHKAWNDAAFRCRNRAQAEMGGVWEQVTEQTASSLVLTCINPQTGRKFSRTVLRTSGGALNVRAYNEQQQTRFAMLAARVPDNPAVDVGGACVPASLFSVLQSTAQAATKVGDFEAFVRRLEQAGDYSAQGDGLAPSAAVSLFAKQGLPLETRDYDLKDVFDRIPEALDAGHAVVLKVADVRMLVSSSQIDKVRDYVDEGSRSDPHMVRVLAVKRDPSGVVDQLAIYDPSLLKLGNEPYWTEPRALAMGFMQPGDVFGRSHLHIAAILANDVYVTKRPLLSPISLHR